MQLVGRPHSLALQRVGLWRIDAEMARYVSRSLRRTWPRLEFTKSREALALSELVVDAWLLGEMPSTPPRSPSVLLGPLCRERDWQQLTEHLLCLNLPFGAAGLERGVRRVVVIGRR